MKIIPSAICSLLLLSLFVIPSSLVLGQEVKYDLQKLLKENQLITYSPQETQLLDDPEKSAIASKGIVWLKDINFKDGTIEVDLRGKDVFLKSFLGIAFHAVDTSTYDVIYFRPFNFRHADTLRRKWSVQYMSIPDFNYARLRKEHPLMYENAVTPVPKADEWFHATIIVRGNDLYVYVNHATEPSLKVKKLNTRTDGKIGLWSDELPGNFANLSITP